VAASTRAVQEKLSGRSGWAGRPRCRTTSTFPAELRAHAPIRRGRAAFWIRASTTASSPPASSGQSSRAPTSRHARISSSPACWSQACMAAWLRTAASSICRRCRRRRRSQRSGSA